MENGKSKPLRGREKETKMLGYYTHYTCALNITLSFPEVEAKIEMPWVVRFSVVRCLSCSLVPIL